MLHLKRKSIDVMHQSLFTGVGEQKKKKEKQKQKQNTGNCGKNQIDWPQVKWTSSADNCTLRPRCVCMIEERCQQNFLVAVLPPPPAVLSDGDLSTVVLSATLYRQSTKRGHQCQRVCRTVKVGASRHVCSVFTFSHKRNLPCCCGAFHV